MICRMLREPSTYSPSETESLPMVSQHPSMLAMVDSNGRYNEPLSPPRFLRHAKMLEENDDSGYEREFQALVNKDTSDDKKEIILLDQIVAYPNGYHYQDNQVLSPVSEKGKTKRGRKSFFT